MKNYQYFICYSLWLIVYADNLYELQISYKFCHINDILKPFESEPVFIDACGVDIFIRKHQFTHGHWLERISF